MENKPLGGQRLPEFTAYDTQGQPTTLGKPQDNWTREQDKPAQGTFS